MLAIIVISFLALIAVALTLFLWQRPASSARVDEKLQPRHFAGLFDDPNAAAGVRLETGTPKLRTALLERARAGDLQTLSEAHAVRDADLYRDVLDALVESASDRQEDFQALVSHISKSNDLRGNRRVAEHFTEAWKSAPDRRATAEMIHIAALSDDAVTYEHAIETVLELWRRGRLPEFRSEELIELFVSQFWVIAPEARRGGAGFALKRKLLGVRRELAAVASAR